MAVRIVVCFALLSMALFGVDAKLTIEKDVEQRARVAVTDASVLEAREVHRLFIADLKLSGHFLPDGTYRKGSFDATADASMKKQEYAIVYRYDDMQGAKLDVKLIRTSDNKELFRKSYAVNREAKMPFLVHKAVYDINRFLTFPDIGWINRYVLYARYTAPRKSEIGVADYTFTYQKSIIRGGLTLFPKWADANRRSFYYTSLSGTVPTLYKLDLYTGKRTKIASGEGMIVCSDVSKDGSKLLLTMAPEGQPDIYEMDLKRGTKTRITRFKGIDVGGRYADDGRVVVFVSNRLGYANIFKKRIGTKAVSQVVFHGRNNNACDAWGKKVVYASRESRSAFKDNRFNIYLTDIDGLETRPLTTTGSNLSPHFSADGNVVLYTKRQGRKTKIGYINVESKQSLLFPLSGKLQSVDW